LLQQILKALDAPYLAALRDGASNLLRGPVYQVIDHLQTVYGQVSPRMLENREQELRTMLYNAKFPINIVFNAVEDFIDFALLGQQPVTQQQTIAKAYVIKQAASSKPSQNGIACQTFRKPGLTSKHSSAKHIKNSEKLPM
jgi:hypothetical protein